MLRSYIPKNQRSTIQNYLYPKITSKMDFNAHLVNISRIHKYEEKNKQNELIDKINEEEKQKKEENLYKLKRFENIPSRLEEQTKEWVIKESEKRRPHPKIYHLSKANNQNFISPYYDPNGDFSKDKNMSLFDKYYSKRLNEIKKNERYLKNNNSSNYLNNENNNYKYNKSEILNSENNKIINKIYEKEELPYDEGFILPKINQNYLKKNIELITNNKVTKRYKEKEKDIIFTHKNYGKTPEYLKQFKLEEIKRKEYEKILEEESHYPPGTKLLSENERINTLNNLIETKKGIINILEKMPITKRTQSIQEKKEELEKKLEQIEKEIEIFSKKKVFIKTN